MKNYFAQKHYLKVLDFVVLYIIYTCFSLWLYLHLGVRHAKTSETDFLAITTILRVVYATGLILLSLPMILLFLNWMVLKFSNFYFKLYIPIRIFLLCVLTQFLIALCFPGLNTDLGLLFAILILILSSCFFGFFGALLFFSFENRQKIKYNSGN
jgi:hypothetical protein